MTIKLVLEEIISTQSTSTFFRSTSVLGDRSGTDGIRNRFSRTFSLYDDPDTRSQVSTTKTYSDVSKIDVV